jgi:hypothetical protein
MEEEEE